MFQTQFCKPSNIPVKNNEGFIQVLELHFSFWEKLSEQISLLLLYLLTSKLLSFQLYHTMLVERGAKVPETATAWPVK